MNQKSKPIRNVFRKTKRTLVPYWRLIIESLLLLIFGLFLLFYIYKIPNQYDGYTIFIESIRNILDGLTLIYNGMISMVSIILFVCLCLLNLILLLGGLWRIGKIITRYNLRSKRKF